LSYYGGKEEKRELVTYLLDIRAERFLTKHVQSLLDYCNGLRSVYISACADPHSLKTGMLDNLVVGIVDLDSPVCILVSCSFKLRWLGAAYCNYLGCRDAIEKGSHV